MKQVDVSGVCGAGVWLSLAAMLLCACETLPVPKSAESEETVSAFEAASKPGPNLARDWLDRDRDGVPAAYDCDDSDPSSLSWLYDEDCDGLTTPNDCDDTDPSNTHAVVRVLNLPGDDWGEIRDRLQGLNDGGCAEFEAGEQYTVDAYQPQTTTTLVNLSDRKDVTIRFNDARIRVTGWSRTAKNPTRMLFRVGVGSENVTLLGPLKLDSPGAYDVWDVVNSDLYGNGKSFRIDSPEPMPVITDPAHPLYGAPRIEALTNFLRNDIVGEASTYEPLVTFEQHLKPDDAAPRYSASTCDYCKSSYPGGEVWDITLVSYGTTAHLGLSSPAPPAVPQVLVARHELRPLKGIYIGSGAIDTRIENIHFGEWLGNTVLGTGGQGLTVHDIRSRPETGRPVSSTAGNFYLRNFEGDIVLDRLDFRGSMDDGFNVHGRLYQVVSASSASSTSTTLTLDSVYLLRAGDQIAFLDPDTAFLSTATIMAPPNTALKTIVVDQAIPVNATLVSNQTRMPNSVTVTDFTMMDGRARGGLIKASNVWIEGFDIRRMGMAAFLIMTENIWHSEGPAAFNVTITGSPGQPGTIEDVGRDRNHYSATAAIVIGANNSQAQQNVQVHNGLTIDNITIQNTLSGGLDVRNASEVTIRNVLFDQVGRSGAAECPTCDAAVYAESADYVLYESTNSVINAPIGTVAHRCDATTTNSPTLGKLCL